VLAQYSAFYSFSSKKKHSGRAVFSVLFIFFPKNNTVLAQYSAFYSFSSKKNNTVVAHIQRFIHFLPKKTTQCSRSNQRLIHFLPKEQHSARAVSKSSFPFYGKSTEKN
jgi:hypothetical protein